jgi:hypothetical protein
MSYSEPKIEAEPDVVIPPITYESVIEEALEATCCDTDCLGKNLKDDLDTLATGIDTAWAPLKATVASIVAKRVHPDWDTRKHQTSMGGKFSLRTVDNRHIANKLCMKGLYDTATAYALTRSFEKAEPFYKSYSGQIKPVSCKHAFLNVIETVNTTASTELLTAMLVYLMTLLKGRKDKHTALKDSILTTSKRLNLNNISDALDKINELSGRGLSVVPVIVVHALLTVIRPHMWPSMTVKPLKQHTAPDGHTDSYGDVEGVNTSDEKPVLVIEVKHRIKVDDTIIHTFNTKTATSEIPLKYILTTACTPKYYAQNNICVQTVSDFITTCLQNTLYHDPSICTAFFNKLQECVADHTNLSPDNKEAVNSILKSLLA